MPGEVRLVRTAWHAQDARHADVAQVWTAAQGETRSREYRQAMREWMGDHFEGYDKTIASAKQRLSPEQWVAISKRASATEGHFACDSAADIAIELNLSPQKVWRQLRVLHAQGEENFLRRGRDRGRPHVHAP